MTEAQHLAVGFVHALQQHGDRVALTDGHQALTYAELAARVDEVARALGPVRRLVRIAALNRIDLVVQHLGALAGGHVVLLAEPGAEHVAAAALDAHYDPDVLISADGAGVRVVERRAGTAHTLHPELALLLSTSGSTGSPKLVRLSADNLDANARSIAAYLGLGPADRAVTALPLSYCYGLSVLHSALVAGAGVVVTPMSVVDACFWDLARATGVTLLPGVPYTFDLLDRLGGPDGLRRLPSLRLVTQAGGRMAPATVRRYAEAGRRDGWSLVVMYGQTEATARMAYLPPERVLDAPGAVGVPVPGGSFSLAPVDGAEEGTGELVYDGPNVMLGYAHSPADLALGRTVERLHTGDLARYDESGLIEIVGRLGRRAKLFGLRLDLSELEQTVAATESFAVVCVADETRLGVLVETGDPTAAARVRGTVSARTGLPERAVVVRAVLLLPRRANGKPDLAAASAVLGPGPEGEVPEARHSAETATATPTADPTDDPTAAVLRVFGDVLVRPGVTVEDTFVGLGGDSLSYVEMSVRLEEVLGRLPASWPRMTVAELAALAERPGRRRIPGFRRVETGVLLRAVAIVLIVGSHANVFDAIGKLEGGAHVLVALVGFNLARFHLGPLSRRARVRGLLRTTARVAVPSSLFIAALVLSMDEHGLANVVFLNSMFGPDEVGPPWEFWFLEVAVQTMLVVTALLSIPAVDRWQRRHPFGFPALLVAVGFAPRLGLVDLAEGPSQVQTAEAVFWLFALGWAAAAASRVWQRAAVSLVGVVGLSGFFDNPRRELLVLAGLCLLVWLRDVPVPLPIARLAGLLAASSLAIYLTHWQVFPHLQDEHPVPALLASLAVGVASFLLLGTLERWWRSAAVAYRTVGSRRPAAVSSASSSSGSPVTRACTSTPSTSAASARAEAGSVSSQRVACSPSSQTRAAGRSSSLRAAAR